MSDRIWLAAMQRITLQCNFCWHPATRNGLNPCQTRFRQRFAGGWHILCHNKMIEALQPRQFRGRPKQQRHDKRTDNPVSLTPFLWWRRTVLFARARVCRGLGQHRWHPMKRKFRRKRIMLESFLACHSLNQAHDKGAGMRVLFWRTISMNLLMLML